MLRRRGGQRPTTRPGLQASRYTGAAVLVTLLVGATVLASWLGHGGASVSVAVGADGAILLACLALFILLRQIGRMARDEAALRRSEEQQRASFDLFCVGMMWVDVASYRFLRVNRKLADMLGYTPEELLGMTAHDVIHPEDRLRRDDPAVQQLAAGHISSHEVEQRYIRKDGTVIWVLTSFTYLDATADRKRYAVAMVQDVTERKEAARRIRLQARLLDAVDEAVIATDAQGVIRYWNRYAETLHGWRADEVVGRDILEVVPAADCVGALAEILQQVGQGQSWTGELMVRRRDGSAFPAGAICSPILDEAGVPAGMVSTLHDATVTRRARQALEGSEEQARQARAKLFEAIEGMQDGVAIYDADGRLTLANTPMRLMMPEVAAHLLPGAPRTEIRRAITAAGYRVMNEAGKPQPLDEAAAHRPRSLRYLLDQGGERQLETRETVTDDGSMVVVRRDVTEARRRDARFVQGQKMEAVGRLTGGLAHDFNNLLMVILINSALLGADLPDGQLREQARTIEKMAARGAELTHRLQAFSRRQPLRPVRVSCNDLVTELVKLLQRTIGEAIVVRTALAADLWMAMVDPHELESAVLNLAVNARDAMPAGGEILIRTANVWPASAAGIDQAELTPGPYVMIAVSDTGEGMSEEVRARAFEPFFTTKEVGKGSGLGLSMVYGFVKQSHGHVVIDSVTGSGTTVTLYLPKAGQSDRVQPLPGRPATPTGGTETILLVEDDEALRQATTALLSGLGYAIVEAADGAAAREILRSERAIDLVLSDVVMPGPVSGWDLVREAGRIRPGLPVLLMTGYSEQMLAEPAPDDAASIPVLSKPADKEQIAHSIRAVLDEAEQAHRLAAR